MPPVDDAPHPHAAAARLRLARNRGRQRELYGAPLGDRLRRLTTVLGITQGRLAHALGLSPAMLSQLASARRVKIGDPAVLARLQLLDRRCAADPPVGRPAVEALLTEVAVARLQWTGAELADEPRTTRRPTPADALRAVAPPARLAAAAAALSPGFPELAHVLREAAVAPRSRPGARVRAAGGARPSTSGPAVR
jgi:transcriptional regulator with XRE-family HTH domain